MTGSHPAQLRFSHLPVVALLVGLIALLVSVAPVQAQEDTSSDSLGVWTTDLSGKLSGSQAAYSNWQEGGVNSLAFTTSLDGTFERRGRHWIQRHQARFGFGILRQDFDQDDKSEVRKADDLIRLESTLRYQGNGFFRIFNPTIAGNVRTQFAKGFAFAGQDNPYPDSNPLGGEIPDGERRLVSKFLAPAFITESIGLTYEPATWVQMRFAFASKQTVVVEDQLKVLYDVDIDKAARVEAGAEYAVDVNRKLSDDIRYKSNLNTFFSFNQTEDPPDVLWGNVLQLKVNDYISTELEVTLLFDKNVDDRVQLKEVLSVGVSFNVL
ncbi:hypothetical protein CRI94_00160 [Longibacter salinarum]|uniref:DUF3078 domain-containing protein n=1 Tax=Longibacter salinarum TaxID=1850348 RepID=A0A2A8D1F9_9BACT|nr:DUF3078 domain-containing protein [Longibacter salinarum]PEN14746.1 hypothetical protein CRI94_00160 [Longibacter salinarum]